MTKEQEDSIFLSLAVQAAFDGVKLNASQISDDLEITNGTASISLKKIALEREEAQ